MASISVSLVSSPSWMPMSNFVKAPGTSAPLSLLAGSKRRPFSLHATQTTTPSRSALLHCSFLPSSSSALSLPSSFSGQSLGLDVGCNVGVRNGNRRGLVVRAGKAALCLTKRSRSRKSLARTHGFRMRMKTTSGRAVLKRRRAKGRWVLCTKSNHNSGKRR